MKVILFGRNKSIYCSYDKCSNIKVWRHFKKLEDFTLVAYSCDDHHEEVKKAIDSFREPKKLDIFQFY